MALLLPLVGLELFFRLAASDSKALSADPIAQAAVSLLRDECFACHNPEKKKGGLILSTREDLVKGGENGPVVTPGKAAEGKLLKVLRADADPHMPPKKQLTEAQMKVVRDWVASGMRWDASAASEDSVVPTSVTLQPLPQSYLPALAIAISPDSTRLAFARGGRVFIHDLTSTNLGCIAAWDAHREAVKALAWSPDSHSIVSGGFRRVATWSVSNGTLLREWTNTLSGPIEAVRISPDGKLLAFGDGGAGRSGFIRVVDISTGNRLAAWRAHADTVYSLEFSSDGQRLLSAGGDKLVKVWDTVSHKELAVLEGHTAQVLSAAFNTNGTQVLSGGVDKQLKVWDIATREKIIALGAHTAAVAAVAWPDHAASVYAVTETGSVLRYSNLKSHSGEQSSATGDETQIGTTDEAALSLAVASDGKWVAVGTQSGTVDVWNSDGKRIAHLKSVESSPGAHTIGVLPAASQRMDPQKSTPLKSAAASAAHLTAPSFKASPVVSIYAEPKALRLSTDSPRAHVLITARTSDGAEVDVTPFARFRHRRHSPFRLGDQGQVIVESAGNGVLEARFEGRDVQIPVEIVGDARPITTSLSTSGPWLPPEPGFTRDVLPALNRAGCSAGACHAKPDGQNGFKLSVFSYDPVHDYSEIVKAARGRRVFPAAPDESLLLRKPLALVPHEGGQRFERGSETHQLIARWIRAGMPYSRTNEPSLEGISVFPKERSYRKGGSQPLLVHAHYSDGSSRDVTDLAAFAENDKEIARVDERGKISIGTVTGQGVVVARYMGFVADSQVLVPSDRVLPESAFAALPRNNVIDELAYAQLRKLGLLPSDNCSDAEFLRRAKIDAIGLIPTPDEVRTFLADVTPDKRRKFIDRILEDPAYADYWANKWADLLRPNPDRVGVKSVFTLDQWLRESFQANKPYDQFVREILLAEGSNHRDGPAVVYRDRRDPPELTTMFSQLFLGTRLECAKCHHHPNEKWSQGDFYQFAAFFGQVKQKGAGLSPPISAGTETFYFAPGGEVKHPLTGQVMQPRAPDGPEEKLAPGLDPRRRLADWLTAPGNPFFARAAVNRVWANFFGRGMVEPVDDFRISNPCANPALLDALAADFEAHHFDFKHLIRTILESHLYQLSSTPNDSNLTDTRNFSRAYRRRLPAEVLLDVVNDATGVPESFAAVPPGFRAMQTWSYKIESHFLDAFGRPNASSDCPCERDRQLSVVQSLHLMNSRNLQAKLAANNGRVHQLADSGRTPGEIVTELYLTMLNRPPTSDEIVRATAAFSAGEANRRTAAEDVAWALLNSPEFVFNH
jgi:WD40 repeat protein